MVVRKAKIIPIRLWGICVLYYKIAKVFGECCRRTEERTQSGSLLWVRSISGTPYNEFRPAAFTFAHRAFAVAAILARAAALIFRLPLVPGFAVFPLSLAHLAF